MEQPQGAAARAGCGWPRSAPLTKPGGASLARHAIAFCSRPRTAIPSGPAAAGGTSPVPCSPSWRLVTAPPRSPVPPYRGGTAAPTGPALKATGEQEPGPGLGGGTGGAPGAGVSVLQERPAPGGGLAGCRQAAPTRLLVLISVCNSSGLLSLRHSQWAFTFSPPRSQGKTRRSGSRASEELFFAAPCPQRSPRVCPAQVSAALGHGSHLGGHAGGSACRRAPVPIPAPLLPRPFPSWASWFVARSSRSAPPAPLCAAGWGLGNAAVGQV